MRTVCIACGHINGPISRFCGKCSAPLTISSSRSAEEWLRALSATGGERKQLSILFADISNSTWLIQNADPEDAMRRIQPAINAMRRGVERYDGIVNKVQGDGVMALFGAPVPREDHAVRACGAALALQAALAELGDRDLRIRVGVHSGEVILQAVVNSLYHTYDVSGSTAHVQKSGADFGIVHSLREQPPVTGHEAAQGWHRVGGMAVQPHHVGVGKDVEQHWQEMQVGRRGFAHPDIAADI